MAYLPQGLYPLDVARGQVTNVSSVLRVGYNPDVDTATTPEDLWAGGGVMTLPTAARIHNIVSDSANDASAGTGARTVTITGLNGSYAVTSETVTMNGVTPVATANSYVVIHDMVTATAGSGGVNAGNITATAQTDATVSAYMPIGFNTAPAGWYMVPAGYTAYVMTWQIAMTQNTAANNAEIYLTVKPFGGVTQVVALHSLSNSGNSNEINGLDGKIIVTEKGFINMRAVSVSASNTYIQGELFLYLVAN